MATQWQGTGNRLALSALGMGEEGALTSISETTDPPFGVRHNRTGCMERKKEVSIFVKAFVAFHVIGITAWSLPNPRPAVQNGSVEPFGTDWILFYNWK